MKWLRYVSSRYANDRYVGQKVRVHQYNPAHFQGMMQVEFADGTLTWFAIVSDMHKFEELKEGLTMYGMAFTTREDRARFFERLRFDPQDVDPGTALAHARATNLGVWGDDGALYQDCARIMAAEVTRHIIETHQVKDYPIPFPTEAVSCSQRFREAYHDARRPNEAQIHNLVRSLGTNRERMDEMNEYARVGRYEGAALYDAILRETSRYHLATWHEEEGE